MNYYFRNYQNRFLKIILSLMILFAAGLLSVALFSDRINKIAGQINNYDSSEFEYAYILNYSTENYDEFIYPDTDILIYNNSPQRERIAISLIMFSEEVMSINGINIGKIAENEIVISRNVAEFYGLNVGDVIFAEYPFSQNQFELTIVEISGYEYDINNPNLNNNIGIGYIGFNSKYVETTNNKYILFSEESMSEQLSTYPQVVHSIITKSKNRDIVLRQSYLTVVIEVLFVILATIVALLLSVLPAYNQLVLLYRKGIKRLNLFFIPIVETMIWIELPCSIIGIILSLIINEPGQLKNIICEIPSLIGLIILLFVTGKGLLFVRRK